MLNEQKHKMELKAREDNAKDGWGFTAESFFFFFFKHKYGDELARAYVEERFTDANYHTSCGLVRSGHYEAAMWDFFDSAFMRIWDGKSDVDVIMERFFGGKE